MKKKLIIVSVLVLCLVFGTVPVMAAEEYEYGVVDGEGFYYEGVFYEFSDEVLADIETNANYTRQALMYYNDYYNYLCIVFYPAACNCLEIVQNSDGWWGVQSTSDSSHYLVRSFRFDLSSFSFMSFVTSTNFDAVWNTVSYDALLNNIIWSDRDIYYNNEVVFLGSPLTEVDLQTIVEELDLKIVILEVIGLVPLVIGLVVCCLGLRKGWSLLVTVLHRV